MIVRSIASNPADAHAASAVEEHHAVLAGALALKVGTVLTAANLDGDRTHVATRDLVDWCRTQLIPHAVAEESTLYAAASALPAGRLLVEGMLTEHAVIISLIDELAADPSPLASAAAGRALRVVFENHLEKENTLLLPLLASTPEVALADLLHGMHRLIGSAPHDGAAAREDAQVPHEGHTCSCGEAEDAGYPALDARDVPHAIRHATIFGALEAIGPGAGLILVAPHDPKPLLAQLERRNPGVFDVEYLEQGPDAWRLAFVRQPA